MKLGCLFLALVFLDLRISSIILSWRRQINFEIPLEFIVESHKEETECCVSFLVVCLFTSR